MKAPFQGHKAAMRLTIAATSRAGVLAAPRPSDRLCPAPGSDDVGAPEKLAVSDDPVVLGFDIDDPGFQEDGVEYPGAAWSDDQRALAKSLA